jgi:hypothetical protein
VQQPLRFRQDDIPLFRNKIAYSLLKMEVI